MRSNSLKTKLLIWFGAVTSFLLIFFSLSFYYVLSSSINDNIKTRLEHQAIDIEQNFDTKRTLSATFALLDENHTIVYKSSGFDLKGIDSYIKSTQTFFILNNEESYENISALYVYKGKKNYIVVYKKDIDNKIEDLVTTLLILNPILFFSLLFMASKMIDKILIPIKNLIEAAKDISVNNFSTTIARPKENDEISELVDSFNEMIKRLKTGVDSLDRFNSDVSHELKTPLTVILGEIEVTLRKTRESGEYEKSLSTVYHEAKQMQKIVENLLLLTKYTQENIADSFELCRVDVILSDLIKKYSTLLKARQIEIHLEKIEDLSMMANPLLIGLVFSNLIDNAIKYSPENKNIYISLYEHDGIHFSIKDEGIGIDQKNIAKITDRFYRVDASRSKKVEGFGLGLSIVKHCVELHNATMHIDSEPDHGTTVEIIF